jgi:methylase of polypeptide subunit release factors
VDIACGKPLANDDRSLVGCFDVVLSNPPYIPRRELSLVAPDVLEFEPHLALFSDPEGVARQLHAEPSDDDQGRDDGLRMYRLLHQAMPSLLKLGTSDSSESKRSVLVEVGSEVQAHQVRDIFMSKQLESAVEFGTAELLLDGRSRHRAALFQTRA